MRMHEKVLSRIILSLLLAVGIGFLWIMFEMLRPYHIVDLNSLTVPPVAIRGQETTYTMDACKYLPIPAELAVAIQNGSVYQLFTQTTSLSTGCHVSIRPFTPPLFIEPGVYRIHWTAIYHPNPFRAVIVDKYSNEFLVK